MLYRPTHERSKRSIWRILFVGTLRQLRRTGAECLVVVSDHGRVRDPGVDPRRFRGGVAESLLQGQLPHAAQGGGRVFGYAEGNAGAVQMIAGWDKRAACTCFCVRSSSSTSGGQLQRHLRRGVGSAMRATTESECRLLQPFGFDSGGYRPSWALEGRVAGRTDRGVRKGGQHVERATDRRPLARNGGRCATRETRERRRIGTPRRWPDLRRQGEQGLGSMPATWH